MQHLQVKEYILFVLYVTIHCFELLEILGKKMTKVLEGYYDVEIVANLMRVIL